MKFDISKIEIGLDWYLKLISPDSTDSTHTANTTHKMPSSSWTDNTTMSAKGLQPEIKFSDFMRICFPHLSKDEVSTKKGTSRTKWFYYMTQPTNVQTSSQIFRELLCNDTQVWGQQKKQQQVEVEMAGIESFTQQDTDWTDFTVERRIDNKNGDYDIYFLNPKTNDVAYITSSDLKL